MSFQHFAPKKGTFYGVPVNHHKRAFCEGCCTHVEVKSKAKINKGWRCAECRSKAPVAATG